MSLQARILVLASVFAVANAIASPLSGPGAKNVASDSVATISGKPRDSLAVKSRSKTGSAPLATGADTLAKPKVDSSDLKQLPPRALPLKEQMMFAGGFMICVAIMLTSMQNFNPND